MGIDTGTSMPQSQYSNLEEVRISFPPPPPPLSFSFLHTSHSNIYQVCQPQKNNYIIQVSERMKIQSLVWIKAQPFFFLFPPFPPPPSLPPILSVHPEGCSSPCWSGSCKTSMISGLKHPEEVYQDIDILFLFLLRMEETSWKCQKCSWWVLLIGVFTFLLTHSPPPPPPPSPTFVVHVNIHHKVNSKIVSYSCQLTFMERWLLTWAEEKTPLPFPFPLPFFSPFFYTF